MKTFQEIDQAIAKGAMIFFAIENNIVLATCMTKPIREDTWEICKLAADERYQGKWAGSGVFEKYMEYAISNNAKNYLSFPVPP